MEVSLIPFQLVTVHMKEKYVYVNIYLSSMCEYENGILLTWSMRETKPNNVATYRTSEKIRFDLYMKQCDIKKVNVMCPNQ